MTDKTYVTLKWGTLKSWNFTTPEGVELLRRYSEIGASASAMAQRDTPEQKQIICKMIDLCGRWVYLDWDGKNVSRAEAKKYVLDYDAPIVAGNRADASSAE